MIIGTFYSVEDGFTGHLYGVGLENITVTVLPSLNERGYSFLISGVNASAPIEIGIGVEVPLKTGYLMRVELDYPLLPRPIRADFALNPTPEGTYYLTWEREKSIV